VCWDFAGDNFIGKALWLSLWNVYPIAHTRLQQPMQLVNSKQTLSSPKQGCSSMVRTQPMEPITHFCELVLPVWLEQKKESELGSIHRFPWKYSHVLFHYRRAGTF
jgi:hypothetical protein